MSQLVTRAEMLNHQNRSSAAKEVNKIVSGLRKSWMEFRTHASILIIAWRSYRNPLVAIEALQKLIVLRRKVLGDHRIMKVAYVDSRCYWDLYAPGLGSPAFKKYIESELNRLQPIPRLHNNEIHYQFTNIFVSITNRCHLQCEHCFEGDVLNTGEHQTPQKFAVKIDALKGLGTSLIHFTGGEPMLRPAEMLRLMTKSDKIDYWILTSGYNFTSKHAGELKSRGLTGVLVSLDHFEKSDHENFRKTAHSYDWAIQAVHNAVAVRLVVALSVCVTRSLATEENLMKYARLARFLGVSFVQLLEPMQAGNYRNRDVGLSRDQLDLLERFYIRMNTCKEFLSFPIFTYHGYHQRRVGCFGSGDRNIYLDTHGNLQACPFCQTHNKSNETDQSVDEQLIELRRTGCPLHAPSADPAS